LYLPETQREVRRLDEKCQVGEQDIDTLTQNVSKLKNQIDNLYEALTSKNSPKVVRSSHDPALQLLTGQDPSDVSDEESAMTPRKETKDTHPHRKSNDNRLSPSEVDRGDEEIESLLGSFWKKYYDAPTSVPQFPREDKTETLRGQQERAGMQWFDDLYKTSDNKRRHDGSRESRDHHQQDARGGSNNLEHPQRHPIREYKSENIKETEMPVSRTKDIVQLKQVETKQEQNIHKNKTHVPQWNIQTDNIKHSTSVKENELKQKMPDSHQNISRDRRETDERITRSKHGVSRHRVCDDDGNIPSHSRYEENIRNNNTRSRQPLSFSSTFGENQEDASKHPEKKKYKFKRLFTSTRYDNRINFKTSGFSLSVAAGEYLQYPPPSDSNIKFHRKPSSNFTGNVGERLPSDR